jgi:sugar O-acyltransferase (sialic acid O-acetyltransferase NeuD family)
MDTLKPPIAIVSLEWDVVDLIESIDVYRILGFFDANRECDALDFRYLGTDDAWPKILEEVPGLKIALAIDSPALRERLFDRYGRSAVVGLRSPQAHVNKRATIGHGCIVQRGVTVMPYAQLDVGCKLNVNCTVHHESRIGAFTTLAPGSQVLGNVTVGERVYVGAGAVIRQRCRIGEGAVIGAGAVVVADVAAGTTVVGVPATRRLR